MKRYKYALVLSALLFTFAGCGGSGGSNDQGNGNNGNGGDQPVVIDSVQKAKNTFAVIGGVVDLEDFVTGDLNYENYIGNGGVRALQSVGSGDYSCPSGGNVQYNVQMDNALQPPKYDIALTFNACKEDVGSEINGSVHYAGTQNAMTITLANLVVKDGSDTTTFDNFTVDTNLSQSHMRLAFNGTAHDTRNGHTETWQMNHMVIDVDHLDSPPQTMAIDGTVSLTSDPAGCADGTYNVETVERVVIDAQTEDPVSGKVKVNGVTYTFNSDGTATATINGQQVTIDPDSVDDINCSLSG